MTEPTLGQWKERALVAEALLEERTQELEGLRAEMEDLKAKQPEASSLKDVMEKSGGWREMPWGMDFAAEYPRKPRRSMSGARIEEYARRLFAKAKSDGAEADAYAKELADIMNGDDMMLLIEIMAMLERGPTPRALDKGPPPAQKAPWPPVDKYSRKKTGSAPWDGWPEAAREYAPQFDVENIQVEQDIASGNLRVGFRYRDEEVQMSINWSDWQRAAMGDPIKGARAIARTAAQGKGLDARSEEYLAAVLSDKLRRLGR